MKALNEMNNVGKGYLLAKLFPEEIPAFLEFAKAVCRSIQEDEDVERAKGEHAIIGFDFWLKLVNHTERRIDRYGERLHKRARLFADQLFDGQNALYMRYCLKLYVEVRRHRNPTFTDLVRVLFYTDKI